MERRFGLCPTCGHYEVMFDRHGNKLGICPECDGNFSNANPNFRPTERKNDGDKKN